MTLTNEQFRERWPNIKRRDLEYLMRQGVVEKAAFGETVWVIHKPEELDALEVAKRLIRSPYDYIADLIQALEAGYYSPDGDIILSDTFKGVPLDMGLDSATTYAAVNPEKTNVDK